MFTTKRSLAASAILGLAALTTGCLDESGPTGPSAPEVNPSTNATGVTSGSAALAFAAVKLSPVAGSEIEGQIEFFDQKDVIVAVGFARKLDPTEKYVTLLFDALSIGSQGDACVNSTGPTPFELGAWKVGRDGTGRLKVVLDKVGLDFSRFAAASIHADSGTGSSPADLRACGLVRPNR